MLYGYTQVRGRECADQAVLLHNRNGFHLGKTVQTQETEQREKRERDSEVPTCSRKRLERENTDEPHLVLVDQPEPVQGSGTGF